MSPIEQEGCGFDNPHTIGRYPIVSNKFKEATKFDTGKLDWSLVPFDALEGMVEVLEFGAKKYSRNNWRENSGFKWLRVCSATLRHMFAFMRGEDNDPETGLSHIYHAQCCLMFLAYYVKNKKEFSKNDDRT